MSNVETRLVSSLAKIFHNEDVSSHPKFKSASVLRGERFSFQLAYKFAKDWGGEISVDVESPLKKNIFLRRVEPTPVKHASYFFDDDVLSKEPGLFPDVLYDCNGKNFRIAPNQWRTIWVTVDIPKNCKPGKYEITPLIVKQNPDGEVTVGRETFTLEVLDAVLPEQELIVTHWFHADCIAVQYNVPVFSEEHWALLDKYFKSFAEHGSNMLLTPVFTPPLDTAVGGERPTTQLIKVKVEKGGKYKFDFTQLDRWIKLAKKHGIKYFEISHLFTQWGAKFCPKIVADVNGVEKRIFGWDVASDSKKYAGFLNAFLPELVKFLKKRKMQDCTYFHCSDEPHIDHMEMYKKAVTLLRKHTEGFKICDALSNIEFYKSGLVSTPIPAEDHIEPFVEAGVKPLWTYYCCGQVNQVSNRFLHMPSSRNRILGYLLYRYDIAGFLQWGFNFWYSVHSLYPVDVFNDPSSDYTFPAGDGFMVYPGKDGNPVESIHSEVFFEGIQDLRALRLLENLIGREKIVAMLDKLSPDGRMTMKAYPRGEETMLKLRKKINDLIKKNI